MGKTINDKLAVRLQVHCFLMKYHTFTFTMYIFAKKKTINSGMNVYMIHISGSGIKANIMSATLT